MANPFYLAPRWRKALRDVQGNLGRTMLVVLSIAVGVFAVGAIAATRSVLSRDLAAAYAATNPLSAALAMDSGFDQELVLAVRRVDGVADAEGLATASVRVKTGDGWRTLELTARQDYRDLRLNKVAPVRGAWPPPRHEVLIERASLALLQADVGEALLIETPDGKQREVRLAGVVHNMHTPPPIFTGQIYGSVTLETLEWLGLPRKLQQLGFTVADARKGDVAYIQEVGQRIKHKVEQGPATVLLVNVPPPGEHPANSVVQPLLLILGGLGSLSLFLSAFLVVNAITALLTQQVPQIGVMKAIGARAGQLLVMYLATAALYGLLALILAVPLSALAAYALSSYLAQLINFDLSGFGLPVPVLITEAVIALAVPLLAALWPVLSGTRVTVREALAPGGSAGGLGRGWIDRAVERLRGLPRPVLLSLRNTFRRKARLALTLTTLTLGGAMFIGVLSVRASLLTTLDIALDYWRYDVELTFAEPYRIERILHEVQQVPGVVDAEVWAVHMGHRVRPDGTEGETMYVGGLPADTKVIRPILLDGRWLVPGDDNAIVLNSEVLHNEPGVKVGDEFTIQIGRKETPWRVVGIVRGVLTGPVAYTSADALARVTQSQGRASRVEIITDQHTPAAQSAIAEALKTRLNESRLQVSTFQTVSSLRDGMVTQVNVIVALMAAMAVLMALVGGLGLAGTMGINVLERSREIGILRAVGAPTGTVLQIVAAEGLLIGVLSWLAGAVFSLPISWLMSKGVGEAVFQTQLDFALSLDGALLWLAIVLTLAGVASLVPALRAARMTVRTVLAYE